MARVFIFLANTLSNLYRKGKPIVRCGTLANPDYVSFIMNSHIRLQRIDAMSRQIIGQANISTEELRSLLIPLPPLEVQRSILEKVYSQRAEAARQRERAAQIRREAEAEIEAMILGTKKV